jgi:hypothetical protein
MEEKREFTRIVCKMKASVRIDNLITVDANNLNIVEGHGNFPV